MTATYDGRLVLRQGSSKASIEACCRELDMRIMDGQVYVSNKAIMLRHRTDNRGEPIQFCPFCGTRAVRE